MVLSPIMLNTTVATISNAFIAFPPLFAVWRYPIPSYKPEICVLTGSNGGTGIFSNGVLVLDKYVLIIRIINDKYVFVKTYKANLSKIFTEVKKCA